MLEEVPAMSTNKKTLALAYLDAVAKQEFGSVERLLAEDLQFRGPASTRTSAQDFISALKRLAAIHVRNDVKRVFVDGDEVCVIYDFVTDTVGVVPTIEWLSFEGARIRSVKLYYDQVPWQTLRQELAKRAAQATS
jgi:hypothetical protein